MALRLKNSSGNYIALDAPSSIATDVTLTLPNNDGDANQVLSTDGSGALSFVDRMTAAGPAFRAYADTQTTLATATYTKVILGAETFDTASCFASSRFTPTVAGYYLANAGANINLVATNYTTGIYKNGSIYNWGVELSANQRSTVSALVYLNGSTDYIEFYIYQASGSNKLTITGSAETYFSAHLARPA